MSVDNGIVCCCCCMGLLALLLLLMCGNGVTGAHEGLNKERLADGAFGREHYREGQHQPGFDHEAILGSRKIIEEFEHLTIENSKKQLKEIVMLMDKNKDGSVDKEELTKWVMKSFNVLNAEESEERFSEADANQDGQVTWEEYVTDMYGVATSENLGNPQDFGDQKMLREDKEVFDASDLDYSGTLDKAEFLSFTHPEEYEHTLEILYRRTMEEKDSDRDGILDFQEFIGAEGKERDKEWLIEERNRFEHDLDKNHDGKMDKAEIQLWLSPNNRDTAEEEALHLIQTSDDNMDGVLSLDEILKHHDAFVGSEITDYGHHLENTHKFKDEL